MELPVEEIRRIEREALARGIALMPRAGLAAARFAAARLARMGQAPLASGRVLPPGAAPRPETQHWACPDGAPSVPDVAPPPFPLPVLALAGPGNNGGDALMAATWLRAWGHPVQAVLYADPDRLPADARLAYDGWRQAGGTTLPDLPADIPALALDGLFGIGLNRPLDETWQARVDTINGWNIPVLALDVPSGLDAASGRELGRAIKAAWTLSFIASAPGLRSPDGLKACGERHLDSLGLA